jgi:hypothetical protein
MKNEDIIEALWDIHGSLPVGEDVPVEFKGKLNKIGASIADLILKLQDAEQEDPEAEEYFAKLWKGYPNEQHDGNPAPHRSKHVCQDRFRKCLKKYKVSPKQLVLAIAAYTSGCMSRKQWIVGLDTLLERKAGYWLDFVEKEK